MDNNTLTPNTRLRTHQAWPPNGQITNGSLLPGSTSRSLKQSVLKRNVAAALLLSCLSLWPSITSAQSLVDNKLLQAVSLVESNGLTTARGDVSSNGTARALGAFQFWRPTWDHVTSLRRKAGLQVTSYKDGATNLLWSRRYAKSYLQWLEKYLRGHGVKHVTPGLIWAAYNVGPGGLKKRGFRLDRCPAHTQRNAKRINVICLKN